MRVFFDDPAFHIETRGGVSRHVSLLARLLSEIKEGPEVHVFAGWNHNCFAQELVASERLRIHRLPRPAKFRITGFARAVSSFWRRRVAASILARPGPNVYHGSFYPLDPTIAHKANLSVCTIHDMIPEMRHTRGRSAQRYRNEKAEATRLADRVVAISEATRTDMERLMPWTTGKSRTIPNTTGLFDTKASTLDPVYSKKHYFLMVGRRDDYKNGVVALRAFARLAMNDRRLGLVLCGGKQTLSEDQLLADLGIADRVRRISPGDAWLRTHYEQAIALLYPSLHEGFGLPVLEAMLSGCPVLTTPLSSLPEVCGEAALYAAADDVSEWTRCMKELMTPAKHAAHQTQGIARAELFRPELQARRMLTFYQDALKEMTGMGHGNSREQQAAVCNKRSLAVL